MQKSTIIVTLCLFLALGGAVYHFYSEHEAKLERERIAREVAQKAATEKERKAAEALQKMQEKEREQAKRLADLERQQGQPDLAPRPGDDGTVVGPLKSGPGPATPKPVNVRQPALIGAGPPAGQPVPPIIPAAEKFIAEARLTSTSLDTSPYAVINRHTYRVGERVSIGPGTDLTILTIDDGFIVLGGGAYKFKMRLSALTQ